MARRYDIAVFDFDGTLVQSNDLKSAGYDRLADQFDGGAAAMAEARGTPGLDRFGVAARFAELLGLGSAEGERLGRLYGEIVDESVIAVPECEGATDLLKALRDAGVAIHLSSATPLSSLDRIIDARGWRSRFDGVHGRPATKPETLARLARETGLAPDRFVVVGDGPDDRDSAREFGAGFMAVGDRLTGERLFTLQEVRAEVAS